jgi:flavodoxin I
MKILNLYCSITGNTKKVALEIEKAAKSLGVIDVTTIEVTKNSDPNSFNLLDFDFIFVGSGVYTWLPPQIMIDFCKDMLKKHVDRNDVKSCAPRIDKKRAVTYCTFGGAHTGVNEAIFAPKFLGQLLDHLGFEVIAEWLIEGQYNSENERFKQFNTEGRMGNITGRPNENDLQRVSSWVTGILKV